LALASVTMAGSLDRIDSGLGYDLGNIQWVHKNVNQMKWTLSQAAFIEICLAVAGNIKEVS